MTAEFLHQVGVGSPESRRIEATGSGRTLMPADPFDVRDLRSPDALQLQGQEHLVPLEHIDHADQAQCTDMKILGFAVRLQFLAVVLHFHERRQGDGAARELLQFRLQLLSSINEALDAAVTYPEPIPAAPVRREELVGGCLQC